MERKLSEDFEEVPCENAVSANYTIGSKINLLKC